MNWRNLLFIGLAVFGAYHYLGNKPIKHGAGVLAPNEPIQRNLDIASSESLNGYQILPLATFDINARVLLKEDYSSGREAEVSPVDFVMGWGRMSDEAVLNQIDISQHNRFYYWRVNEFPIPQEEIETHSANMHMIPADSLVAKKLESVRIGQIVSLRGYLVEVKASDGWHWRSSLTRKDTGNGACEVVLVKSIEVI